MVFRLGCRPVKTTRRDPTESELHLEANTTPSGCLGVDHSVCGTYVLFVEITSSVYVVL